MFSFIWSDDGVISITISLFWMDVVWKEGRKKKGSRNNILNVVLFAVVSGGDMEDLSPYEPIAPNRQPDEFGLAAISSGTTPAFML